MSHNKPSQLPTATTKANVVSRISRYPETKPPLRREVHAPCSRPRKFDLSNNFKLESSNSVVSGIGISNALFENHQCTKYSALATTPLQGKEKDDHKEVVSEDSKDEDVEEVCAVPVEVEAVNGGIQKQSSSVSELSNDKLNVVDDAAKILDTLSLDPENDVSSVRAYKKLLEAVDKRTDTIGRLRFEIQLNEKRRTGFDLLRPKKELVEVKTC